MTIARVQTFAFSGIEALPVEVQVQIAPGLPVFLVVGLADKAVGEARERVRAALTSMGLALPPKRILVNLAPADLLKEGSHFDLPIALAVLTAMEILPADEMSQFAAIGELSLDGRINAVAGVLPAALAAASRDLGLICPEAQGAEAGWAGEMGVLASPDLLCLINHFRGTQLLGPPPKGMLDTPAPTADLAEVRGMATARRALEIAASGGHNMLMIGPPGGGKSMLAARMPGLLPTLPRARRWRSAWSTASPGCSRMAGSSPARLIATRITQRARRRWPGEATVPSRARSRWRTGVCCSSTSCLPYNIANDLYDMPGAPTKRLTLLGFWLGFRIF